MRLSEFKIKLAKQFWDMTLTDNEQPELRFNGYSSPQMKGAKFLSLKFKHRNILLAEIRNIRQKILFIKIDKQLFQCI